MGLRCLLGHDFGEPETERERNEEGNEVVVTVREVKTCERCGEKQVVSENKEITSIDQLRESATDGQPGTEQSTTGETGASTGDEWGTDDPSPGRTEEPTPAESTSVDSAGPDATSADAASTDEGSETVEPDEDPIERGVADIIEQAEKDDDMLQQPPAEADEGEDAPVEDADESGTDEAESDDDVPVHPGQRSAAAEASESPEPESDDGVILDDEASSPPEEGRRQWEEEASPEEVPGQDLSVGESSESEPEGDDAKILDAGPETTSSESAPRSEPDTEPATSETDATEQSTTPSAVESEDAEIMDAGTEASSEPEPEPSEASPEPSPEPEPSESSGREETDEGHMPWPEAPGEDEGHDASPPDGETAEVDLSGGLAPAEEPDGTESTTADTAESTTADTAESTTDDRANGHRTESGEAGDASAAPNANVDLQQSSRDAQLEYYCPECGLTRDVGNSSMRAGDICPECRVGYITEQQKAE
jgi:hypothetical protein